MYLDEQPSQIPNQTRNPHFLFKNKKTIRFDKPYKITFNDILPKIEWICCLFVIGIDY
jgi:hypothetical protein